MVEMSLVNDILLPVVWIITIIKTNIYKNYKRDLRGKVGEE